VTVGTVPRVCAVACVRSVLLVVRLRLTVTGGQLLPIVRSVTAVHPGMQPEEPDDECDPDPVVR